MYFQPGPKGDLEDKMACLIKCHFKYQLPPEKKWSQDINKLLIIELTRLYRDHFRLDTSEKLKPNKYLYMQRDQNWGTTNKRPWKLKQKFETY